MSRVRPAEIAEMAKRRLDGQTLEEIGRAMGRHPDTVRKYVADRAGWLIRNEVSPGIKARMIGLAKAGYTSAEIGNAVGFSAATVWSHTKGDLVLGREVRREETRRRRIEIAQAYDAARSPQDRKRLLAKFAVSTSESLKVLACQGRKLIAEARA